MILGLFPLSVSDSCSYISASDIFGVGMRLNFTSLNWWSCSSTMAHDVSLPVLRAERYVLSL